MAIRTTGVRYDVIGRDSASRAFGTAGRSASKLEKGLGKLGKAAKLASLALGAGIAAGLAEGAKKAVEFQAEMLKIQTQAGASAKDVKTLSAQVLELGKTAQQGPQQLSEALYHLKSVGMDNVAAMKALKVSSDLAAVGGSNLEETTNALAGAWRTGIRGATNMQQAAQTLNATIGAGNMTMEDMVAALGTGILPTAKTFGLTLSQVGAALALFTDEGVDSASAATRLRMSISLLGAPSKAAEKQLGRIKLSGKQLGNAMRGPDGIIGAISLLKQRLDASGLSATDSAALLSHAFGGGKSSSAILSMVNNLDVLEAKQKQVNSSMGKYGPAVAAQRKTAAAQLAIIKSNLEVFAIKTGNVLLPPLTSFVTYITRTALPAVHGFSHELVTKLVPVDAIKQQFTTLTTGVSDFFAGFKPAAKKAKIKLPSPTIEGPTIPDSIKKPYAFKVPSPTLKGSKTTIPSLIAKPKKQDSQAKQFGAQLRKLISGGIGDAIKNAAKDIDWGKLGKQIGGGLATAIGWVGQHMADLTKKVITALSKIDYVQIGKSFGRMAIPLAIGIVTSLFDPLFSLDFWKKHWLDTVIAVVTAIPVGRVGGALAKVFEHIPVLKFFSPFLKRIGGLGKAVEKPMGSILKGVGKVAKGIGKGFIDGLEKVFPGMSRSVTTKFRGLVYAVYSAGIDIGAAAVKATKGLGNGILKGAEGLGKIIGRIVGWIVKPFAKGGGWLVGKGAAVVRGLRAGIATGAAKLATWVTDHVVRPVTSRFAAAGSWLVHRGSSIISGLRSGITAGISGVGKWLGTHVISHITSAFTKAGSWLVHSGGSLVSGLFSGALTWLSDAAHGAGAWASTVKGKIVGAIKGVFGIHSPSTVMAGLGGHMMAGLLNGLLSGRQALENAVKGLFSSPLAAAKNLLVNGIALPAEWAAKVAGGVKTGAKKVTSTVGSIIGHIPGFASGGMAGVGTTAWVGERGPELMQVTSRGVRIISNPKSMALALAGKAGDLIPGFASGTGGAAAARVSAAQRKVNSAQSSVDAWRRRESEAHSKRLKHIDSLNLQAAEKRLSAAKAQLSAAKKHQTAVTSVSNTIANGFLKTITTGTASAIASAVKSMNTKLQAAGGGRLVAGNNRTSARLQALAAQRASLQSRVSAAKGYASDQASSLGDFLGVGDTSGSTVSDLLIQMKSQQSIAKKFATEVARLSKMGLSKTLLSQLADAGPGSQLASILNGASAFDVKNLNAVAASQNKLTKAYGNTLADAMYDAGSQAGKGFLAGLTAQEKALQAEMDRLGASMVKGIKKRLGIRSPSRVMRDQVGKQVAMGAAAGVREHGAHAVRETQRMADLMGAVRARGGAQGGRGGVVVVGQPDVHVHVHFDDPTLRDLIRAEAEPVSRGEVEAFARELMAAATNTGG